MKKWVVQITDTRVYNITVEAETKEGAYSLDDDFIADLLWRSPDFNETEIDVLGEEGKIWSDDE